MPTVSSADFAVPVPRAHGCPLNAVPGFKMARLAAGVGVASFVVLPKPPLCKGRCHGSAVTEGLKTSPAPPLSLAHPKSPHAPYKERGRYFLSPKSNQKGPLIPGQRTHGLRGL